MPSRKKLKGKARKAKAKATNEFHNEFRVFGRKVTSLETLAKYGSGGQCTHGLPLTLPIDHPCIQFDNTFTDEWMRQLGASKEDELSVLPAADALQYANKIHPGVIEGNHFNQEIMKSYYVFSGIQCLISCNSIDEAALTPQLFATANYMAISFAFAYKLVDSHVHIENNTYMYATPSEMLAYLDIMEGCHRSLIKFFMKHSPCACLDRLYSDVKKTTPKTGLCTCCRERKERRSLFYCARCKAVQYCSKKCQLSSWPEHRMKCIEQCVSSECRRLLDLSQSDISSE